MAAVAEAKVEVLDTRGLLCPYPFLKAKKVLESLPRGSSLEVLTDSQATAESSIPILCEQNGYTFTGGKEGDEWRFTIRKP